MFEIYKPYFNGRLIKKDEKDFYVIRPAEHVEVVPLFCPLCSFAMRTLEDEKAFRIMQCCHFCEENIVYPNRRRWTEEDWRPSAAELKEVNKLRPMLSFMLK